ncbi:unnamed protein product, partial [Urochloa humidicola]
QRGERVVVGNSDKSELNNTSPIQLGTLKELVQNMSENEFTIFLKKKAEEILDMAVSNVLEDVSDKVMVEGDEETLQEEIRTMKNQAKEGVAGALEVLKAQAKKAAEKSQAAAAIAEAALSPARSSPRLAGSSDEHTMDKAQRRAAVRALELNKGDLQNGVLDQNVVPNV